MSLLNKSRSFISKTHSDRERVSSEDRKEVDGDVGEENFNPPVSLIGHNDEISIS